MKTVRFSLKKYRNYLIVAAVLLLFLTLDLLGGLKRTDANLLTQIAYSVILAVSLNLVVGFLGELSLGHAGFMCVGAYIGGVAAVAMHRAIGSGVLALILSTVVGGVAAALAGFVIGVPTLRLKGDYLAIVTLAFGEIVRTVFRNQPVFGGALGLDTSSVRFGTKLYIPALLLVLLTLFVVQNLMDSKHGRAIKAIRDSEIAARASGIAVTKYKLTVFVIAAFFAGIAGVIYAHHASPVDYGYFSFNTSIDILVMVVLGGMGNVTGTMISAAALTFIDVKLTTALSLDAAVRNLIYALILILLVIWNNAPALRHVREKYSMAALLRKISVRLFPKKAEEDRESAAWDKIPTKIPMDAILSADMQPDHAFTPDPPEKEEKP